MLTTAIQRGVALDRLLFSICETLQLSPTQYKKAVDRYLALADALNSPKSPFSFLETNLYSQGSMRLGTTVKPIDGPYDLDFVCELAISHDHADPIDLLDRLFGFLKEHSVYGGMVERKNRCVRIIYQDDFYLDILPACRDHGIGGTCVQVPDREADDWKPSNPIGYGDWFEQQTLGLVVTQFSESSRMFAMDKAASIEPIPALEATGEKTVLQLAVQLLKRWRDVNYSDSSFPPISIVLTTLAADCYNGEELVSVALLGILERIVARLDAAQASHRRLKVPNPVHPDEDFSERWKENPRAYREFDAGIRKLAIAWRHICVSENNSDRRLEELFGTVVNTVRSREARLFQAAREQNQVGIETTGILTTLASSTIPMLRNTNHGK